MDLPAAGRGEVTNRGKHLTSTEARVLQGGPKLGEWLPELGAQGCPTRLVGAVHERIVHDALCVREVDETELHAVDASGRPHRGLVVGEAVDEDCERHRQIRG